MKRRPMSNRTSRKVFRKGNHVKKKNMVSGGLAVMRGGIRL